MEKEEEEDKPSPMELTWDQTRGRNEEWERRIPSDGNEFSWDQEEEDEVER